MMPFQLRTRMTATLLGLTVIAACRAQPIDDLFPVKAAPARATPSATATTAASSPATRIEEGKTHPAILAALQAVVQEATLTSGTTTLTQDTVAVIIGYMPANDVGAGDSTQVHMQLRVAGYLLRDRARSDSLVMRFVPRMSTEDASYLSHRVGGAWTASRVSPRALVFAAVLLGRRDLIALSTQDWQRLERASNGV